jgi:hypothetical protein
MTMLELLPFAAFAVLMAATVGWFVRKDRADKAARARKLATMGFVPCEDEIQSLAETITRLENNAEYRYSVEAPQRAKIGEHKAYYYMKNRKRSGYTVANEEFLISLKRPSSDGLMLFVKPSDISASSATHLIGAVATGAWDSRPDDLVELDLPRDLGKTNFVGALGPRGSSLYDLIDSQKLTLLQQAGDCGAFIVTCRDDLCSFTSPAQRMPLDLDRIRGMVEQLS